MERHSAPWEIQNQLRRLWGELAGIASPGSGGGEAIEAAYDNAAMAMKVARMVSAPAARRASAAARAVAPVVNTSPTISFQPE